CARYRHEYKKIFDFW
nr:immunoglobulin heavy chain junction region [Macaca mulatta]MOW48624.1 immunoglobulin heavy chain junction region [Macaca mulatta]MOW48895.1 immunoglobulin heavy chain junction region [Macaca mulatta]MOW50140.1 immunoglobulin heavy chain junction region [Macaca mulatta]